MNIIGKVISIDEVRSGIGKNGPWKNQEFLIETLETHQQLTLHTFRESIMNELRNGIIRDFEFNFSVSEFNGRRYNNHILTSMRAVDLGQNESKPATEATPTETAPTPSATPTPVQPTADKKDDKGLQEKEGELPF